ncbi:MAG TPA: tetratricopeptide repeat protein [Anaerolineaceae bacterium]
MSPNRVKSFESLRTTAEKASRAAAGLPASGREVERNLKSLDQEFILTHQELQSRLEAIRSSLELGNQDTQVVAESAVMQFNELHNQKVKATSTLVEQAGYPQREMDNLGDVFQRGLFASQECLEALEQADITADRERDHRLAEVDSGLEKASELLQKFSGSLLSIESAFRVDLGIRLSNEKQDVSQDGLSLNQAAVSAWESGMSARSLALLEQAHRLNPESIEIQLNLAEVLDYLGEHSRAQAILEHVEADHPDIFRVGLLRGMVALHTGDYPNAVVILQESLNHAINIEDRVAGFLMLGDAYYKNGQPANAVVSWRNALNLDRTHPVAQERLDWVE